MNLNIVGHEQFTTYSASSVTIHGQKYEKNILVFDNQISEFAINAIRDVTLESLGDIIAHKPDLIIFGTSKSSACLDIKLQAKINSYQIGLEVMSIPALCRTYNFLISEDRRVACLIFFEVT